MANYALARLLLLFPQREPLSFLLCESFYTRHVFLAAGRDLIPYEEFARRFDIASMPRCAALPASKLPSIVGMQIHLVDQA